MVSYNWILATSSKLYMDYATDTNTREIADSAVGAGVTSRALFQSTLSRIDAELESVRLLLSSRSTLSASVTDVDLVLRGMESTLLARRKQLESLRSTYEFVASTELNTIRIQYANSQWLLNSEDSPNVDSASQNLPYSLELVSNVCGKSVLFVERNISLILERRLTKEQFFVFEREFEAFWFRCPSCHHATKHAAYVEECEVTCGRCHLEAVVKAGVTTEITNCRVKCEHCGPIHRYSYDNQCGPVVCKRCGGSCELFRLNHQTTEYEQGTRRKLLYRGPFEIKYVKQYLIEQGLEVETIPRSLVSVGCRASDVYLIEEAIRTLHLTTGHEPDSYSIVVKRD